MKHKTLGTYILLLITLAAMLMSCQRSSPTAVSPMPEATPTALPPLSPQVIQVDPDGGEELPLDAPISLLFDQAMDPQTVEAAFAIEPAVSGKFDWPSPRLLRFKPTGKGFERATRYTVSIKETACSAEGLALKSGVRFHFTTIGYLEVAEVQPADGTTEVATDALVTVLFNRPVVPLTPVEGQADLPQPVTFDPPVAGTGEWLNTSIYIFRPDEGFEPATTYEAQIAAGLTDTTGSVLEEDVTWKFTTVMPAVVATYPEDDTIYVSPEPTIYVAFNQPMERASVEAAFELKNAATGERVPGIFAWHDTGLVPPRGHTYRPYRWSWSEGSGPERVGVETMIFTPTQALERGATYRAVVKSGARSISGQPGQAFPYSWLFDVIRPPAILHTRPADGEVGVAPWDGLVVEFLTPMDPQSINHNFSIQPPVTQTEVFTYWWDNNTHLEISFPTEPNTDYAVTLSGEIRDRYGHPLGEDTTIHWSTRGYRPMVDLTVPGRTGTYNAYTSTHVALTVRNLGLVHFALYRMSLDDFLATNGEDQWSAWKKYHGDWEQLIRQWSQEVSPPVNQSRIYSLELTNENGTRLPPGIYYLEVWGDYDSIYPQALPVMGWDDDDIQRHILVVSRYNVSLKTTSSEALVWVTDMRSGDVVPNVPVIVMDEKGHFISEGMTDEDGVFVADEHKPYDMWKPIFAFVGDPEHPDDDFAAHINRWSGGIQPWNFDLPIEEYNQPLSAYFFTDRPIYRPGQEVYFKGVLRYDDDAHYTLPPADQPVRVAIYDAQGTKVYEEKLSLSDMGTLNGALTLEEEAPLGTYHIEASYGKYDFGTSFRVAEYRKPEFQVTVETDRAEYVQGDTIRVSAQATYFFGGPVANAEVRYAVLTNDVYFRYPGPGWWSFADYRDWDWWWEGGAYGELVTEGEGTTDAEGRFTFRVEADIAEYLSSQRFTLEVTVTDVNHQQVSNRTDAVIHKGMYYIGMRPQSYVGQVDKESAVEIITVDWAGDPSPGRSLEVTAGKRTWYSVKKQMEDGRYYWESVTEDTPVYTTTVTSDANGEAVVHFTPQEGGVYYVRAVGKDQHGNEIRSATYLWVSDQHYVSWRRENNDRIELVADRREYQVGDTAHILVPHPYQGQVKALVTLERGHIYQHWVQTLETNSDQINIPITEDLIPNVFVSVVIVKGQDETNPSPDFKVGYVELPIVVTEKNLNITMTPDRPADKHYQPGETVTYDVQVTDSRGRPVEAELALNLVDLSVLSLSDQPTSIVDHFWRQRGIGVWTANALTLSGNRVYEQLASEVKGLGGGGGLEEAGTIRRRFPDTAYWNPALRTDENGQATVQVELPDNLTTWRMGARGVTADTLVGQADVDIVSTKDLLVRPVAPRFFVVGDRAELAAIVHNNSNQTLDVSVRFEANRLTIGTASMETPISVSPGEHVEIIWPVTVGDGEETTLLFSAQAVGHPELSDAVEITLPIYHYSTPEVVATVGQLDADGQQVEAVVLPPSYDPTQGELRVQIDPSLAAGMTKGLEYLKHYPYECTEQTVSRFLPNIVTYRALQQLGIKDPTLEAHLPGLVRSGLQRLYNHQHYDGGWGWWVLSDSDPYLTAYVLLGMIEADRAGFAVDEGVMERAGDFLVDTLTASHDVVQHWQANRQAFVLYVLAEAERGDLGRTINLFEQREKLDIFGEAYLALALNLLQPDESSRVDTILSDITSAAILSASGAHWEEEHPDYYAMNTDTRSTAIVLATLARLDPENRLAANAVRWLMVARKDGYWETTQETAWSIIALTDWMVATGELEGAYDWQVVLNARQLGSGSVSPETIRDTAELQIAVGELLADEANRVIIERWAPAGAETGKGRLYYSLYLRYFKPVAEVTALNRGIIVGRQYYLADCVNRLETEANTGEEESEGECPPITQARVGDVIQVKLTIIAPHSLHYVVIEDPLPAGTEGVDQSLKTTSVIGEAPQLLRTDRRHPWGGAYGWWWFSHTDLRDEKAVLFATYLPKGTYEYTYLIRASLPGEYNTIPTTAYEMYFPEVFGRSDGVQFIITE